MSTPDSRRVAVFAALFAGAVIGAVSMWAVHSEPSSVPAAVPEALQQEIARSALDAQSLRERVARLEQRLDETRIQSDRSSSAIPDRREPVQVSKRTSDDRPENGGTPASPGIAIHDTQWVSVLDLALASRLIEHGLTPFQPGVNGPLKDAGDALRAEENRWNEEYARLTRLGVMTPGYQESSQAISAQHLKTRKEILARFSAALDALKN
jgi:hypothetical protein